MNDVIKLLPDSVANQIAAGEVIQQPSSVIKELVENAVDAGATKIDIVIKDAGRTLIQVIDNGCGMTPTDARLAFERHSTSKIRQADDLFSLTTMGFRGEALASIAAISQLDVRTMPHDASIGTRLIINASKVESQEPQVTAPGTNFMVRNIFFNVPARRKFLKKDSVEFTNILHEFERLALVNTDVEMSLTHNEQLVYRLNRSNLKTRIGELFGRSVEDNLVPIELKTDIIRFTGYIGTPESARKRGALQYFFVNGRNMKHPYFRKAVLNCYEGLIKSDLQPNFFINFNVDPHSIDVNIHPTKNEIKFEDEQPIWQLLSASVKESLGKFNFGPAISFDDPSPIEIPGIELSSPSNTKSFQSDFDKKSNYNPFNTEKRVSGQHQYEQQRKQLLNWEALYQDTPDVSAEKPTDTTGYVPKFLQVKNRFILLSSQDGLLVLDQRRAHLKVIYEKYLQELTCASMNSQNLLFQGSMKLEPSKSLLLENITDILEESGFRLRPEEDDLWYIEAVPTVIGENDGTEIIENILDELINEPTSTDDVLDSLRQKVALSLAKATAINYGKTLNEDEMENLVGSLFALADPKYDPLGRLIIADITFGRLEDLFEK